MDIRFLIVGTPFIICFFYALFWLKKWGAFNSSFNNNPKKMTSKNEQESGDLILENIFLTKN
tara:strand:+ start:316 stop:501 length:186 start_codon:yes stop_codon:yes gene_type:complete